MRGVEGDVKERLQKLQSDICEAILNDEDVIAEGKLFPFIYVYAQQPCVQTTSS